VREVVGRRLDHLSEECNRVLTVGAVLGREFTLEALERVILRQAQDERLVGDRLLEAVEEALAARVITEVPQSVGRYSFAHALIKETLYEELTATRRVRLHQQVAEELEALYGDAAEEHADELAHHYGQAAAIGGPEKLVQYATAAGRLAASRHAYEEAVRYFKTALMAREDAPPDDEWADLKYRLGRSLSAVLEIRESLRCHREAFTYYADNGDIDRAVEVAESVGSYTPYLSATQWRILERALELVEPGSKEAGRLLACSGWSYGMMGDYERGRKSLDEGLQIAIDRGDRAGELQVLGFRVAVDLFHLHLDEALDAGLRTIELAEQLGDERREGITRFFVASLELQMGRPDEAMKHANACRAVAELTRDEYSLASAALSQAWVPYSAGEMAVARGYLEEGLAAAERDPRHLGLLGRMYTELGEFEVARAYLDRLTAVMDEEYVSADIALVYPIIANLIPHYGLLSGESVDLDRAQRAAQTVLQNPILAVPLVATYAHLGLAQVALAKDDAELVASEYAALEPYAGVWWSETQPTDSLLGLLAAKMGRIDESIGHFEAARVFPKGGYRLAHVWIAYWYATVLVERDAEGDREKAQQLVQETLTAAEELGLRPLMEKALKLKLELQGVDSTNMNASIDAVASLVYAEKPDLRPQAAPDGTVTLLFSDIEGSTAKTEELGDQRWMEVLREHNAIVRDQLAAHDGFEVKAEGDGFMLAFQSARKALQCAIETQKAFAKRAESSDVPILVRMGLHTGEVIKEGDDFFGKHVNLAARIAGQAQGGEILVSSLLKELTSSSGDIDFSAGREVELKGLTGSQQVYSIGWQ
jgi:class 3 adenylate cyclase